MKPMNESQALRAMKAFLSQYYARTGNDLETLIADITIDSNGATLDPAAWDDWLSCVNAVRESEEGTD